ncbi:ParB/RepB/Spo0J family partition protein [Pontibacter sp. G13]|uniref:ParB/RepB/Spo0J family partition protein n=1 Tax=Pontibacter sp. G13 TaxID=3074898 RepID=UPI00288C39B1|nr:ParB/RepB/Spo0J family partition protein [Pontibacter sp. G13]WNJ19870.1 ParB/RepB/Spo0J family partition protein [Pontibacter sp. G13]
MAAKRKRQALGRGLGSILPETPDENPLSSEIPIHQIELNPYQPRKHFDEEMLEELAKSIEIHGVIQPITVRKLADAQFQLISGERRLRASKLAGLKQVPVYIRTADDEQMLEMALIENIQREDLNPIEIANSYQLMIDELGLKQEDLGEKVGKKRSTVTNYVSLLKLPDAVKAALRDGGISMGHAKTLKNIEDHILQMGLFQDILDRGLSVRQAEELARKLKQRTSGKGDPKELEKPSVHDIHLRKVADTLTDRFGNKVKLNQKKDGKGEISIPFNNTDDLNRILDILDL